jgi:hypothetical protein
MARGEDTSQHPGRQPSWIRYGYRDHGKGQVTVTAAVDRRTVANVGDERFHEYDEEASDDGVIASLHISGATYPSSRIVIPRYSPSGQKLGDDWHGRPYAQNSAEQGPRIQQHFTGPGFDDVQSPAHVSWLGASGGTPREHAEAVKTMMGLVATKYGATMPTADRYLSEDGARISRNMGKRAGIRPHPSNPDMKANIGEIDETAIMSTNIENHEHVHARKGSGYEADDHDVTAAQAAMRRPKKQKPETAQQLTLPGMR